MGVASGSPVLADIRHPYRGFHVDRERAETWTGHRSSASEFGNTLTIADSV